MKHTFIQRFSFFLLLLIQFSVSAQEQNIEQQLKEAEAELQKAFNCDFLIGELDKQIVEMRNTGSPAVGEIIAELEKAKKDIRDNCKNGVYLPDQDIQTVEEIEEDEEMPSEYQAILDRMLNAQKDTGLMQEYYAISEGKFGEIPYQINFYQETTLTLASFPTWMKDNYKVDLREISRTEDLVKYQHFVNNIPVHNSFYLLILNEQQKPVKTRGELFSVEISSQGSILSHAEVLEKLRATDATIIPSSNWKEEKVIVAQNLNPHTKKFFVCYVFTNRKKILYVNASTANIVAQESLFFDCFHHEIAEHIEEEKPATPIVPANIPCDTVILNGRNNPVKLATQYYGVRDFKTQHTTITQNYALITPTSPLLIVTDSLDFDKWKYNFVFSKNNFWNCEKEKEKGLLDIFWSLNQVQQYFKSIGRNGFDGKSGDLYAHRIYDYYGSELVNAFWHRDKNQIVVGSNSGKSLGCLDVMAHEFMHGVINTSSKVGTTGEAGAINEGLSDIFGIVLERYANVGDPWLLGEKPFPGGLRNLKEPHQSKKPRAKNYDDKYWKDVSKCIPTDENDECFIHTNQTVMTSWFYLLTKGGSGINEVGNKYDIPQPMEFYKAAKFIYECIFHLDAYTDFEKFADITIAEAERKFGKTSAEVCAIKSAWYAVNVHSDPNVACVPGWTFTIGDDSKVKTMFYGKGDSVVITSLDYESNTYSKLYSVKSSAYWNIVAQTEEGIKTGKIQKQFKFYDEKTAQNTMDAMEVISISEREKMKQQLSDPSLSNEDRARIKNNIAESEQLMKKWKAEYEKGMEELRSYEEDKPELIKEKDFWSPDFTKRDFDKKYKKRSFIYENLKCKEYVLEFGSWIVTTEMPYSIGDVTVFLPAGQNGMKLGVDHFMRGFPLKIIGQTIAKNIYKTVPGNYNALFSDAPVFR